MYLNDLKTIIEKYTIDEVALQSIVESCLETEDISYKKAQTAYLFSNGDSYSQKISNVKSTFNLSYAMQILSASKKIVSNDKINLIIGILEVLRILKNATTISLSDIEAKILVVITENLGRTQEDIIKKVNSLDINDDNINKDDICNALKNLENMGIISLDDGIYHIVEKVVIEN